MDNGKQYQLLVCKGCGSARSTPLPTDERLARLYFESFDYHWYQDHFSAKLKDCKLRIQECKNLLGHRVLDFGGGIGYFSQAAREAGYISVTYDPFASTTSPLAGQWDTVVALHVLEHANDLERTCIQIKKFLAPGGNLILAVPNFSGIGYRDRGMRWVWAQPPLVHIFHFTAQGLSALFSRHGFGNIQVTFHERWDANYQADVVNAEYFRRWDAAWGYRILCKVPGYRKMIAAINSHRRFRILQESTSTPMESRAELLIQATLV